MRCRREEVTMEDQYDVDHMRPKCLELQRVCERYKDLLRRRRSLLAQSRHLYHTVDTANLWCSQGVDLLASQPLDRCQTSQGAEESLTEIDQYLRTFRELRLSDPPQELKSSFGDVLTSESRAAVQQVLQRVEDVQAMCEKRRHSLRRMCSHPSSSPPHPHPHPHPGAHPAPSVSGPSSHHHHHHHPPPPHPSAFPPHPSHPPASQVNSPVHLRRQGSAAGALEKRSPLSRDKGVRRRTSDSQLIPTSASAICHPHPHPHAHPHHPHHDLIIASSNTNTTTTNNSHCKSSCNSSSNSSSGVSSKTSSIAASDASSGDLGPMTCGAGNRAGAATGSGGGGGGGSEDGSGTGGGSGSGGRQRDSLSSSSVSSLPEVDVLQAKRRHVMNELIETEKTYVTELQEILWGYCKEIESRAMQHIIPEELIGQKHVLFGNLEQICKFHAETFLQELQECQNYPAKVGRCFVKRKEEFQMYSIYCQNKPKSEALRMRVGDSNPFFKECQDRLGHKLPLGAYLLKPVQRITKYQLLLKEMLRFTCQDGELEHQLQDALDTMLSVLQYLNASMHQVHIVGYQDNLLDLGRLLLHGGFSVWTEHKRERIKDLRFKPMQRHIFLYERGLLLCKKKEEGHEDPVYTFKNKLKLSQVGLTEKLKGDKRRFELWSRGREEVYIIQACSLQVKDVWVKEIKRVLMNQFDQIRSHRKMYVPTSQEESSVSSQLSSDSSDYSLDSWRSGGGGPTTITTTTPPTIPPSPTTSTTGTTTPPKAATAPCNIVYNNNNSNHHHQHQHHHHHGQPQHNSTLPVGLEMISPLTPPSSAGAAFPHSPLSAPPPPPFPPRPQSRRRGSGGRERGRSVETVGEEGVEQWSSGELSFHEEEEEEEVEEEESDEQRALMTAVEPSYPQPFVSLGRYEAMDSSELGMAEGDMVEVLRVGGHGWWYARCLASGAEGWVPSTFLDPWLPPPHHPAPPGHPSLQGAHQALNGNSSSESLSTTPGKQMSPSRGSSQSGSPYHLSSPVSETTL